MEENHHKIQRFSLESDALHATKSFAKEEHRKHSQISNFLLRNFMQRVSTKRGDDNDLEKQVECKAEIHLGKGRSREVLNTGSRCPSE